MLERRRVEAEIQTLRTSGAREDLAVLFVYPSYSIFKDALAAAVKARSAPGREVPDYVKDVVELIGVEPTTSSLQSWRSTN